MEQFYRHMVSPANLNHVRQRLVKEHGIPAQMVRDKDVMDVMGRALTAYGPVVEGNLWYLDVRDAGGPAQYFAQKRDDVNRMAVYELNQAIKSAYALDDENERTNLDWQHREILDRSHSDRGGSVRQHPLETWNRYW